MTTLADVGTDVGHLDFHEDDPRVVPLAPEPQPEVTPGVSIDGVSKVFRGPGGNVAALDNINLSVAPGEFVCLLGASGCGKSTLLNLIAGLDKPTARHGADRGPTGADVPGGRAVPVADGRARTSPWR